MRSVISGSLVIASLIGVAAYVGWTRVGVDPIASHPPARPMNHRAPRAREWLTSAATLDLGAMPGRVRRAWRGPGHASTEPETAAQAEQMLELYRRWDDERFGALFHDGADPSVLAERIAWFRERLGACEPPEVLNVDDDGAVRWVYACERGELEAQMQLDDDGRVRGLFIGAHRIEPPEHVLAAAQLMLRLQREWSTELFDAHFSTTFDEAETRAYVASFTEQWGICEIEGVDLGGEHGALLDVSCDRGPRLLKVELGDDGKLIETWFGKPREF